MMLCLQEKLKGAMETTALSAKVEISTKYALEAATLNYYISRAQIAAARFPFYHDKKLDNHYSQMTVDELQQKLLEIPEEELVLSQRLLAAEQRLTSKQNLAIWAVGCMRENKQLYAPPLQIVDYVHYFQMYFTNMTDAECAQEMRLF